MRRATTIQAAGSFDANVALDRVVLDADERHRRRFVLTGENGTKFLLDLDRAVALKQGDGLVLEDGSIVTVAGRPEPLIEIEAKSPLDLVRLAWHLGNRHTQVEIVGGRLRIRRDHVLESMVAGLGGKLTAIEAPFEPEAGAHVHAQGEHTHGDHDRHRHEHACSHGS
jgi:urease accessory protein